MIGGGETGIRGVLVLVMERVGRRGRYSLCTFDQVVDSIGGWNYGLLNKRLWCARASTCLSLCVSVGKSERLSACVCACMCVRVCVR